EQAPTKRLFARPSHPYTLGLLKSVPRLDGDPEDELASIEGSPPDLAALPVGCPFAARCPFVIDLCREEMPPLDEIAPIHAIRCWVDVGSGQPREIKAAVAIPCPSGRGLG